MDVLPRLVTLSAMLACLAVSFDEEQQKYHSGFHVIPKTLNIDTTAPSNRTTLFLFNVFPSIL